MTHDLAPERLRELLRYDAETGTLWWIARIGSVVPGQQAGKAGNRGYVKLKIDRVYCVAHRVAWVLHHGHPIPRGMQIDHINGDRGDNRIANLRLATGSQNKWNAPAHKTNRSGFKGVTLHKASGLWVATIKANTTRHHLGYFRTPEQAHAAYKAAADRLHGEFARHK